MQSEGIDISVESQHLIIHKRVLLYTFTIDCDQSLIAH